MLLREMPTMHHREHQVPLEVILDTLPQPAECLVLMELLVDTMLLQEEPQLPLMEHLLRVAEHQLPILHPQVHQHQVFPHIDLLEQELLQVVSDLLVVPLLALAHHQMQLQRPPVVLRE